MSKKHDLNIIMPRFAALREDIADLIHQYHMIWVKKEYNVIMKSYKELTEEEKKRDREKANVIMKVVFDCIASCEEKRRKECEYQPLKSV